MPERRSRMAGSPVECANCGAEIPRHAKACPACGADEQTGWRDSDVYDGLDLPAEAYDAADTPRRRSRRTNGLAWYWWLVAIGLVILLVFAIR